MWIGMPSSALQTAVGATNTFFPIEQSPIIIANGCMYAVSSILGDVTFSTTNVFTLDIMFGHCLDIIDVSLIVSWPMAKGFWYPKLIVNTRIKDNVITTTEYVAQLFFIRLVIDCKI